MDVSGGEATGDASGGQSESGGDVTENTRRLTAATDDTEDTT
jgi:hypothetical protein